MARPTFADVAAQIDALLADNTTGDITPADVRTVFDSIAALFQPAAGALTGAPAAALALTTTDTKVAVFDTVLPGFGEAGVITPNIANDDITTTLVGVHRLDFTTDAEGPNNDDLIFTVYRDGVATVVAAEVALRGPANKVSLTMNFPMQSPAPGPHSFDVRARLRTGSGTVTFSNAILTLSYIPGQ